MVVSFLLMLLLQTPRPAAPSVPVMPTVVVGLRDCMTVTVANPEFSGFINGRGVDAVLIYRAGHVHGEMPLRTISRIEFGEYKKGRPFYIKVMLRNGDQLNVESEQRNFVTIKGRTELGDVTIKHPDPLAVPVRITTSRPNRKRDLTIQYLEFPPS